jgi:D-alanyl-D-alanine carboxypeptidase
MSAPHRFVLLFLLASGAPQVLLSQPTRLRRAELVRVVDSLATAAAKTGAAAGFSVAVAVGSSSRFTKGYGFADLEQRVPAGPETVYRIASITKQFTAAAIMQLAEQGKLSLDDRLTKFLPEWPAPGDQVTVRMLLNHTSGIRDYTAVPRWGALRALPLSHDSLLGLVIREPFDFPPGSAWRYDNTGYYLLGVIIEKVSGMGYGDYVEQRLARPHGLTTIRYCDSRPLIAKRARGYNRTKDGFVNAGYIDMNQPYAAGSLCAAVGDLIGWSHALASGKVVSADGYRQMTTPVPLPEDQPMSYGFGLSTGTLGGHRFVFHNGSIDGFHSQLVTYPDDSLTIAIVANTEAPLPESLERQIARRLLRITETVVKDLPTPAELVARVAGNYHQGDAVIRVAPEGEGLTITLPGAPATRLLYQGGEQFVPASRREVTVTFRIEGTTATAIVLATPGATLMLKRAP